MSTDEDQIREVVAMWQAASKAGDTVAVLRLMTDDVVFLVPGRPPMGKSDFAAQSRVQSGSAATITGSSDIQEIVIAAGWAFMWTKLAVVMTPADGKPSITRAGHTLTVLRKVDGAWLLARDANLLSVVSP